MLSTYDLFKLYFNVINRFISKEDVREALFQYGLVEFNPSNATFISKPLEIHYNGYVAIINIKDTEISVGMPIIIKNKGYFRSAKIVDIQIDGNSISTVDNGEVGIKLSEKVDNKVEFWKKNDN